MSAAVVLYWIPLGAGGHSVKHNGRAFEAVQAWRGHRSRCALLHAALVVDVDGVHHAIELAPALAGDGRPRGVVATGPVGARRLGALRHFRYEVRCWPGGVIPDLAEAVEAATVSRDAPVARRVLALVAQVPTPVWGRDELRAGEMWNSNSVVAWLLVRAGVPAERLALPRGCRAPGWGAGVVVARRVMTRRRATGEDAIIARRAPRPALPSPRRQLARRAP
jgi:hypothetical protein